MIAMASWCSFASVFSQEAKKVLDQFDVQAYASNTPAIQKAVIGPDEELSIYTLHHYKYTLNPKQNKAYKEYQVIKLDGMSNADLLIGLITSTLERESRYIEISGEKQNAIVREVLKDKADYVFVSPFEKEYFIASDGTFRYIDGRELVGSKKVKTYLEKGKPVTAATFFFAMKNKGLISADVSLRHFIALNLDEKVKLLEMDVYASPKDTATQTAGELH